MLNSFYNLRHYFEKHGFYVSSRFADRLGIKAKNIISEMNEENLSISFINLQEIAESFQDWI